MNQNISFFPFFHISTLCFECLKEWLLFYCFFSTYHSHVLLSSGVLCTYTSSTFVLSPWILPTIVPVLLFFTQPPIPSWTHRSLQYFVKYTPVKETNKKLRRWNWCVACPYGPVNITIMLVPFHSQGQEEHLFCEISRCLGGSMKITTIWVITSCSLDELDKRFRGAYCLHHQSDIYLSPWLWRQSALLESLSTSTRIHGAISHKTIIFRTFIVIV
jgi:hypothetical protein